MKTEMDEIKIKELQKQIEDKERELDIFRKIEDKYGLNFKQFTKMISINNEISALYEKLLRLKGR